MARVFDPKLKIKKKDNNKMNVKELISKLKECPQDLPVLMVVDDLNGGEDNHFVAIVEVSETGQSGYEIGGEVRLLI